MSIGRHLSETMNTKYVQEIIAQSSLQRDVSLVSLEELLARCSGAARIGVALLDIDRIAVVKNMGAPVKLELIEAVHKRLTAHLPPGGELFWMGNDEFVIVNPSITEEQPFEAWLRVFIDTALDKAFRLGSARGLDAISATLRGALGVVDPRSVGASDLYLRGVLGSRRAKLIGPGALVGLADGQIETVRLEIPEMLIKLVRALAVEQDRSIDDVAAEALEASLRRYHR